MNFELIKEQVQKNRLTIYEKYSLYSKIIKDLAFIVIQNSFEIFKLNPATYYVDVVPVNFSLLHLLLLNLGTILATTLMLVIPSYLVSKISPDKTIRFDWLFD